MNEVALRSLPNGNEHEVRCDADADEAGNQENIHDYLGEALS